MNVPEAIALCRKLTNEDLTRRLGALVAHEHRALAVLILHLAEFDSRRLYSDHACPSMYVYCTKRLEYSESAAYKRIHVARTAVKYPLVYDLLAWGHLHMRALLILGPHMTPENHRKVLTAARGKNRLELETIAAELAPKSVTADFIQRLPPSRSAPPRGTADATAMLPAPMPGPSIISPLAPDRIRFGFTGDSALMGLLRRARELLRRKFPRGGLEDIFREALNALLERLDPGRRVPIKARRRNVETNNRSIPPSVKDAVRRRDGDRCTFRDKSDRRCGAREFLEFDHVVPWSLGGRSDDAGNIRLLCRAHNQLAARRIFGSAADRSGTNVRSHS